MNNLVFTPAYELARMIRDRTVSAVEVIEAYLSLVDRAIYTRNNWSVLNMKSKDQLISAAYGLMS